MVHNVCPRGEVKKNFNLGIVYCIQYDRTDHTHIYFGPITRLRADFLYEVFILSRFQTPSSTLVRCFPATDPMSQVVLYLQSKGFSAVEFKILSSWPRRDVCFVYLLINFEHHSSVAQAGFECFAAVSQN